MNLWRPRPSMGICCMIAIYAREDGWFPRWLSDAINENGNSIRPLCRSCRQDQLVLKADSACEQTR